MSEWVSSVCLQIGYLPVKRSQILIERVHYEEKVRALFQQVLCAFDIRQIIVEHIVERHVLRRFGFGAQNPQRLKWQADDKLQILRKMWTKKRVFIDKMSTKQMQFSELRGRAICNGHLWHGKHFTSNIPKTKLLEIPHQVLKRRCCENLPIHTNTYTVRMQMLVWPSTL